MLARSIARNFLVQSLTKKQKFVFGSLRCSEFGSSVQSTISETLRKGLNADLNHDIKDDTKSLQDVLPINELEEEVLPTTELKEEVLPTNEKEQLHLNAEMENSPKIMVVGVGGAGSNAVNNMISQNLAGVEFLVCNTDAQHLKTSLTENRIQMGSNVTGGLGAGANPEMGKRAAEHSIDAVLEKVASANMVFVTAGMGGGTGTGAAPIIAKAAMDAGILTVAVVTQPFRFEGTHRLKLAKLGLEELRKSVDTMIVIPNQNLFQMATAETSLMDAFRIADDVLLAGVKNITDLMVMPGLINLDFADVQSVMTGMGSAMMGCGEAEGEHRAITAAEKALDTPLLGHVSVQDAKGMIVNITGGQDMTLFEVDAAAERITKEVKDPTANIIFGSTFDDTMDGKIRVSVVATGIHDLSDEQEQQQTVKPIKIY